MSLNESLCDVYRVNFYRQLLGNATAAAKEDGVDLQVPAWPVSLLADVFCHAQIIHELILTSFMMMSPCVVSV